MPQIFYKFLYYPLKDCEEAQYECGLCDRVSTTGRSSKGAKLCLSFRKARDFTQLAWLHLALNLPALLHMGDCLSDY